MALNSHCSMLSILQCKVSAFLGPGQSLRSESTPVHDGDEQLRLSQSGLAQCKLLLYGSLVKHYSHTDRPPLLPQHMTDIYTAITDLLGESEDCDSQTVLSH